MKKLTSKSFKFIPAALGLLFALLAYSANGQLTTNYWNIPASNPTPNGNWDDQNWTTDPSGNLADIYWQEGSVPVFSAATNLATGVFTITVNNDHTNAGLQVLSGTVTINGPGRLFLTNGIMPLIGTNVTINAVLADVDGTCGFQTAAGNYVYLNGTNTFSGGVNLNLGSTFITNNNALGTGAITPITSGFSALYTTGGSPLTLANNYTIGTATAGINFATSAGTPLTNSGTVNLQQTFYCRYGGPGGETRSPSVAPVVFSGAITNTGGLVVSANYSDKLDPQIVLTGANTYTGKTIVGQGGGVRTVLGFTSIQPVGSTTPNSLGCPPDSTTGQIDVGNGAFTCALDYLGAGNSTTDRTINNVSTGNMWLFGDGTGAITYSGSINVGSGAKTLTLQASSSSSTALNTISGILQDNGGALSVTKDGSGTWVLSGANTYTGMTTVQNSLSSLGVAAGTLIINGSISTGGVTINAGTIIINGTIGDTGATSYNLSPSGTCTVKIGNNNALGTKTTTYGSTVGSTGVTFQSANANSYTLPVGLTIGNSVTFGAAGTGNLTFGGAVNTGSGAKTYTVNYITLTLNGTISGNGAITLAGTGGTMVIGGTRSGTGATTVSSGTLLVNGTSGTSSSGAVTVANNATLGGTGTIYGAVTVSAGGTIQPTLSGSVGTLTLASATAPSFAATSTLHIRVPSNAGADTVSLTSTSPAFACGNLALVIDTTGLSGNVSGLTIVQVAKSSGGISGTFSSVTANNGYTATVHYNTQTITVDLCTTPSTYNVTGGGTICSGGSVAVGLDNSQSGVNYQLQLNSVNTGLPVAGTGSAISLGNQTAAGVYTVVATSAAGGCTANMNGSATVAVNGKSVDPTGASALPSTITSGQSTTLTLTGGGGGTGETIHWYSGSCGGTAVGMGNNLSVSPTATTTYYGRYEDGAPCNYNSACASVAVTVSSSLASVTISNISGTTLTYGGGAGAHFILLQSSDATAHLNAWSRVNTNPATPGTFTIPAVGTASPVFYSIKSE